MPQPNGFDGSSGDTISKVTATKSEVTATKSEERREYK